MCWQALDQCLSRSVHLEMYCLDEGEGKLHLVRMTWNSIFVLEDSQNVDTDNREIQYAAYRQLTIWQHECLGRGKWKADTELLHSLH